MKRLWKAFARPTCKTKRHNKAPLWTPREIRIRDTWGEYQVYPALPAP